MILKLNHLQGKTAASTAQEVVGTLYTLLDEGHLSQDQFASLQIQLDWLQYKQNFREVAMAVCEECLNPSAQRPPIMDVHIDTRQVAPNCLRVDLLRALARTRPENPDPHQDRVLLEEFKPLRTSIVWDFNRLYWTRLNDWEAATGKGYETSLPGGQSDGHQEQAIGDSVGDAWTLLKDMESKNQLPTEIFLLEIGVGTGTRMGLWLKKFKELDAQRGSNFYPKLRILLGDYSLQTLDMSKPAVAEHADLCSFLVLDAMNPLKSLSFLRHKVLHVHLTNVYDNLPDEEILRRDGRLYSVQVRAFVRMEDAHKIAQEYGFPVEKFGATVHRLLEGGFDHLGDHSRGVALWQEIWKAVRLDERVVALEDLRDFVYPAGLDLAKLEDMMQNAPSDLRFHLSSGALESFHNTLPLLHPRGYLQVQDIFVTDLAQYRLGYWGPGKLDGSLLSWVNGALLKEVGERNGYDVHFAPFHYRKASKTSILYTTRRE